MAGAVDLIAFRQDANRGGGGGTRYNNLTNTPRETSDGD